MIQTIPSKFNSFPVYYNIGGSPEPPGPDPTKPLTFTAVNGAAYIALNKNSSPSAINLQYSINGGTWTNYTWSGSNGTLINLSSGDTVAFSGNNNTFSKNLSNYYQFAMTGTIEADGNIQSLMNFRNSCPTNSFPMLFMDCKTLTKAPIFGATTIANYCYYGAFIKCSSLIESPIILATTVTGTSQGCYSYMFLNCTSLTKAPIIQTTPAKWCFQSLFQGCTALSSIEVNWTSWVTTDDPYFDWVKSVPSTGYREFIKPAELPEEYGNNRIPSGWTVVNK